MVQKLINGLADHCAVSIIISGKAEPIDVIEAQSSSRVLHLHIAGGGSVYVRESALVAVYVGPVPVIDEATEPFHLDDGTEIIIEAPFNS